MYYNKNECVCLAFRVIPVNFFEGDGPDELDEQLLIWIMVQPGPETVSVGFFT